MPKPLRVLLWSPPGAGLHYSGPGMTAFRMYSKAPAGTFDLSLAHGKTYQEHHPLFRQCVYIAPSEPTLRSQWSFTRRGRRWMAEHASEFDIVHGLQGFHPTMVPCLEAQRRGVPAIVKFAMHKFELEEKKGWRGLLGTAKRRRGMAKELSAVVAISRDIYDELLEHGVDEKRIARIPNGVDTELFFPVRDDAERRALRGELGWRDLPTVLFVGAVSGRKRSHLMVEALGIAKKRGAEGQLVIAGPIQDEEYAAAMRTKARDLDIEANVIWAGFSPDVAPMYRAADCYALPSSSEGLPNAMLEAMASSLPAFGTRISGIVDLIDDGATGRLVDPTAESIAEAMEPYLRDVALARRHGAGAFAMIQRCYSLDAVLAAHEKLFENILAGRPPADASIEMARAGR